MFKYEPICKFRENRKYVNTADIYSYIFNGIDCVDKFKFKSDLLINFRSIARSSVYVVYYIGNVAGERPEAVCADFSFVSDVGQVNGFVVDSGKEIMESITYDTRSMIESSRINDKSITIDNYTAHSPIEMITCISNFLHDTLAKPDNKRKWRIAKLSLGNRIDSPTCKSITINIVRSLASQYTLSEILIDSELVGNIHYAIGDE